MRQQSPTKLEALRERVYQQLVDLSRQVAYLHKRIDDLERKQRQSSSNKEVK